MKKLNTPLSISSYPIGSELGRVAFGFPVGITATWYDHGDIYFDSDEINIIKEFIRYKISRDPRYPDKIESLIRVLSRRVAKQKCPDQTNLARLDLPQLIVRFKKERQLFLYLIGFMSYRGSVQMGDVLMEKLRTILAFRLGNKKRLSGLADIVEKLSMPLYPSVVAEEKLFSLRSAIGFSTAPLAEKNRRIDLYLKKYGWLPFHWFVGKTLTFHDISARFFALEKGADTEIKNHLLDTKVQKIKIERIITALGFDLSEKMLLRQYRSWLFLRTYIKDCINQAAYNLLPILYEIAKKSRIAAKDIVFLTLQEVDTITKFSLTELTKKINKRQPGFSAGISGSIFNFGNFAKPLISAPASEQGVIKGSPAFKGLVKGIVSVLSSPRDQHKLQRGEILVVSMTTPDFLPAMERAAGFITDEGGITCHAAIVAREMKKPCVIGTRTATKILKDGDRVELDAEKGIVRII